MIEALRELDQSFFHTINTEWASGFLDSLCPVLRSYMFLAMSYITLAATVYAFHPHPKLFLKILLLAGFTFLLTDQLSSSVIKPWIHRVRPCNNPVMEARLLVQHCGSGFSFVSSHAANVFGL